MKQSATSNAVTDDTARSLAQVRVQAGKPLRDIILRIHARRWAENNKSLMFLSRLKCFIPTQAGETIRLYNNNGKTRPAKTLLKLCSPVGGYAAVSYPWETSDGEHKTVGKYELLDGNNPIIVRDVVLDRIIRFIRYKRGSGNMIPFWIDQLSINQNSPSEQEIGMQSMDLVYKQCSFAIGYLWVEIKTQAQLDCLSELLSGRIVKDTPEKQWPILMEGVNTRKVHEVIDLLVHVTDDQWWNRAWIFQEDYLAGIKMFLLIRHSHELDKTHSQNQLEDLPGELIVKSEEFRTYATLFCLASREIMDQDCTINRKCKKILSKAGKYIILHKYRVGGGNIQRTLTNIILEDINNREITVRSDILAIAANVCDYHVRIPVPKEHKARISLSLSILALYISNGEMITNNCRDMDLHGNVFDFLRTNTPSINTPLPDGALTFTKHCRLPISHLTTAGIHTRGILWKLSDLILPDHIRQSLYTEGKHVSQRYMYRNGLSKYQRYRLLDLARVLKKRNKRRYKYLADSLTAYLEKHE